jgi:lysozyme family protein
MDACVHHGVRGRTKRGTVTGANPMLQRVLGVEADGIIGRMTLSALDNAVRVGLEAFVVTNYLEARLQRFRSIIAADPSQAIWDRGWKNRIADLKRSIAAIPPACVPAPAGPTSTGGA